MIVPLVFVSTGGLCAIVPYFLFRVHVTSSRSSFGLNLRSEMSDFDSSPPFTVCPAPSELRQSGRVLPSTGLGFPTSGSLILGSSSNSVKSYTHLCTAHCGLPKLSLHGLGHPTPTPEVFHTSHRDGVQTIHGDQSTICLLYTSPSPRD